MYPVLWKGRCEGGIYTIATVRDNTGKVRRGTRVEMSEERRYRRYCIMCGEEVDVKLVVFEYEEADIWELECVECGCIVSTRVAILGIEPYEWVIE